MSNRYVIEEKEKVTVLSLPNFGVFFLSCCSAKDNILMGNLTMEEFRVIVGLILFHKTDLLC